MDIYSNQIIFIFVIICQTIISGRCIGGSVPLLEQHNPLPVNTNAKPNCSYYISFNGMQLNDWGMFDYAGDYIGGLARVKRNGKYGYIDPKGHIGMPLKYEEASDYNDGIAAVQSLINHKWGCINTVGESIIDNKYDNIRIGYPHTVYGIYSNKIIPFSKDGKWGFIDQDGKTIINAIYDDAYCMSNDLAAVRYEDEGSKNMHWGFVGITGKNIISPQYRIVWSFSEGLAAVAQDEKWGYINKDGVIIIPFLWKWAWPFSCGRALVGDNHRVGFIDNKGHIIVSMIYLAASTFEENVAAVEVERTSLWGYIDTSGKMVITPRYLRVGSFRNGVAYVLGEHEYGYIDKAGEFIWKQKY